MNWKNMTPAQKVAMVISWIAVAVWAIAKVKPDLFPMDPSFPAVTVFTLCDAMLCWKNQRKWAYLLLGAAAVSTACFILEMFI